MTKASEMESTKRLMGALGRMPPKPHSEMKLSKKREPGKPSPRPESRKKRDNRS